ncbi:MAG TPA: heat-inducible transcriptional repressor HrcA [Dongiaceae bacterium]|jgi:heat-inducible transcriptional repressor|nr:heat-inducible transcriptional repressor HrcA [Verrucomicrobiae bacterium]
MNVLSSAPPAVRDLSERSREVFRHIVAAYVESGEPVGSRTISRRLGMALSPATIRNVMADLEDAGLLFAPHTSAGRLPTDLGLRLFVHGLLELGRLTEAERQSIEGQCAAVGRSLPDVLAQATDALAGLSHCAGLVMAPKSDRALRHIEFVHLGPGRALVVIVTDDGLVENRIIDVPMGLPASSLIEASNFLSARLVGRTIAEAKLAITTELSAQRAELDLLTQKVVEAGLASWTPTGGALIIRGQAQLLDDVTALSDLERIRTLFSALEKKEALARLLEAAETAEGVQIYIGAESELFGLSGCSLVVAPYRNGQQRIVGAVGVIGPTRIDYARVIPMVDYTAQLIGRMIG